VDEIAKHFSNLDKEQMIADAMDRVRKIRDEGTGNGDGR
jgi:hypothetical protein